MSEKRSNEGAGKNLFAVPFDALQSGMEIFGDIYDSNAERVLVRGNTLLNEKMIYMVGNLNKGGGSVYVSENTYKQIYNDKPAETENTIVRQELEQETGYSDFKKNTLKVMDTITKEKTLHQDMLYFMSNKLSKKLDEVEPTTIVSLVNALAPVDEYLQRHCVNVSLLNGMVGKWMGMSKEDIDRLVLIGLLHDCGKALVPTQVLNVPRKLTAVEFEVIKMHPVHSYNLLEGFPEYVRVAVRGHHEKVNAKGYPDSVATEAISLDARITAISDIYDAMVSQRAYKTPKSPFSTLAMLSELKGTDLDGEVVDLFVQKMPQELIDKEVMMSDGVVGTVHSFDLKDIEYPTISVNGRITKSSENWHCKSMYTKE